MVMYEHQFTYMLMTSLHSSDILPPIQVQSDALEGISIATVNPLVATESLPLVAIQHYYENVDQALQRLPARRLSARTSQYVEVARSPETSDSLSAMYFDHAAETAEHIAIKHPDAPYLEVIETSLLTTFVPAFQSLRGGGQPTSDIIGDIYERLGCIMNEVEDIPLLARNRAGFEAKLAILALGARLGTTETLYLPPTTRESRNVGINKQFNHSVYTMDEGQKVAARVRFSHKSTAQMPHPTILSLSFSGIVRQTAKQVRNALLTPQNVLDMLRQEAGSYPIGSRVMLLDELSDVVRTNILSFSKTNADLL